MRESRGRAVRRNNHRNLYGVCSSGRLPGKARMSNFAALVAQWGTGLGPKAIRHYTAATAPLLAENRVGLSKPVLQVFPPLVLRSRTRLVQVTE